MKRSTIFVIAVAVVAVHAAIFWLVADKPTLPKRTHVPPPSFIAKEAVVIDRATGERTTYREFTVSTRLAGERAKSADAEHGAID